MSEAGPKRGADPTQLLGSKPGTPAIDPTLPLGKPAANPAVDQTMPLGNPSASAPPPITTLQPVARAFYSVGEEIARGGMGRILLAEDLRLGRRVAIKELLADTPELRARFEREARITARLEHPSIVSLHEAGVWPTGEPFYVMRLVSGRPLDAVITATTTLRDRLALLPAVIAVVDALAYAHGERVIHRDLKPANVLVGDFGETVVIDWGLAKDLADGEVEATATTLSPAAARRAEAGATMAGAIMGTPAYMSPEQARGELVDARTDVYALGALLYHVLAAEAPYRGPSSERILADVLAGAPRALDEHDVHAPPDLVAIVGKCMARRREDRYDTAKELSAELKKFQTGQLVESHRYTVGQLVRRWLRKNRTAVAVAAVAAAVLAVLAGVGLQRILAERARTEEQRVAAVKNRDEAESLVSYMLGTLRDKLTAIDKVELLQGISERAVAYYDARGPADLGDDERASLAAARDNLAVVLMRQGDYVHARAHAVAARELRADLAARAPDEVATVRALAVSETRIAMLDYAQDRKPEAIAGYRSAIARLDAVLARAPRDPETLNATIDALGRLSSTRGMTDIEIDAGALLRRALELEAEVISLTPTADNQIKIASLDERYGDLLLATSQQDAANAAYAAALAAVDKVVGTEPENYPARFHRSESRGRIAYVALWQDRARDAIPLLQAAVDDGERVVQHDPANGIYGLGLEDKHRELSEAYLRRHQASEATREARAALALAAALVAKQPMNTGYQHELEQAHQYLAASLLAAGDVPGALAEARAAVAVVRPLATESPKDRYHRRYLIEALYTLVEVLVRDGDKAGAVDAARESVTLARAALADEPEDLELARYVVATLAQQGAALALADRPDDALASYDEALTKARVLRAKISVRELDAFTLEGEGDVHARRHERDAARRAYEEAQALRTDAAKRDPDDAGAKAAAAAVTAKLTAL